MNSLVSYPDRGPWGSSRYRGNCSGHLVRDLLRHYTPRAVADPAEGSGTTGDVCRELGIAYHGFDLRTGFNLVRTPLASVVPSPVDFVFFHPPYYRIIRYSGWVWGTGPHPGDLSHENDWGRYIQALRRMVDNALSALSANGRLAVLIGDVRQQGRYYSAQAYLVMAYGAHVVESVLIKAQHNVTSDRIEYSDSKLIRIMHEYVIVLRKPAPEVAGHG